MSSSIEIICHACTSTTTVRADGDRGIAQQLSQRRWRNDRGVIACPAHSWVEVMPRHSLWRVPR